MKFIILAAIAATMAGCANYVPPTPQQQQAAQQWQNVIDAGFKAAQQRGEARINKQCFRSAVTGQMIGDPKYCGY